MHLNQYPDILTIKDCQDTFAGQPRHEFCGCCMKMSYPPSALVTVGA